MKIKKTYTNIFFCISIILFTLSACSSENASALVLETYLLEEMSWEGDGEYFTPQDGSMEAVLAKRESERLKPA
jgi:hypothetical protein